MSARRIVTKRSLRLEAPTMAPEGEMIYAGHMADETGLPFTVYWTTDPLVRFGSWEFSNPRPRIARDEYRQVPFVTVLPARYFDA